MKQMAQGRLGNRTFWLVCALLVGAAFGARAQFAQIPSPVLPAAPVASEAEDASAYRLEAARHVYAAFPSRIHKGKLPPMMYAVMITEADVDASGQVIDVRVIRPPAAAKEVTPWVVSLIRRAAPFPAPVRMAGGSAVWREIWLVDKTGTFQVDALTEGQR
jgi:protein TonB